MSPYYCYWECTTGVRFLAWAGICFLFTTASRRALGLTHPIKWAPGALSRRVKQPGRKADHSGLVACSDCDFTSKSMNPIRHLSSFFGRGISSLEGLYVHRTAKQGKTRVHIHYSSGIRTHDPSVRVDHRTATGTGFVLQRYSKT